MSFSRETTTQFGTILIRRFNDFSLLIDDARNAGLDVADIEGHVVSMYPACRGPASQHIQAVSVCLDLDSTVEDARRTLAAMGLRPCTPHETLCIAIDRGDAIRRFENHVALGRTWPARHGDVAMRLVRDCGVTCVTTSRCDRTFPPDGTWKFLAAVTR